jgi:hypothetical protein
MPEVDGHEKRLLLIEQGAIVLKGITAARIFRKGQAPIEVEPGSNLAEMLSIHTGSDTDGGSL